MKPSLLVVVAHPDDETLGAGALIASMRDVRVVHATDGAPRRVEDARAAGFEDPRAYAEARRREAVAALGLAGVPAAHIHGLGFPDQELSFHLAAAARALAALIRELEPAVVLTHAYEGGHPDHDGTAFAAHAACALAAAGAERGAPMLLEMGLYHLRDGRIRRLELPPNAPPGTGAVLTCVLDGAARTLKAAMLARYATQRAVIGAFPTGVERFRRAGRHDFGAPPHAGPLHYERHDWGVTGARWRALALAAMRDLPLGREAARAHGARERVREVHGSCRFRS